MKWLMRPFHTSFGLLLLVATAFASDRAVAADEIRAGGTGTSIGLLRQMSTTFTAETGVRLDVVLGLGSSGSLRALSDRKIEIAVAARPLKPAETAAGLREVMTLRTAFVMATSKPNPEGLASADIAKFYAASSATWPDGTPVRIVLRPRTETDSDLLVQYFPGMGDAIEAARRRAEVPIAPTDQDNVALGERLSGSLVSTTAMQLKTEGVPLHALTIDGVAPTLANTESGTYRYTKKLHIIVRSPESPAVAKIVAFLRSPAGSTLLRDAEVIPETK